MTKRSRHVALAILGASAFALAGCTDETVDAQAFPDLKSCEAAANMGGQLSVQDCKTAFEEAQALHLESAPRYDSLEGCEAQHGEGACGDGSTAQSGGGGMGSIFMPLMMGYLMGSMMGGGNRGVAASQPMYKSANGGFTNATGTTSYSSNQGAGKFSASQFTRPPSTIDKPPMSSTTAASRGGFGSSSTSAGG